MNALGSTYVFCGRRIFYFQNVIHVFCRDFLKLNTISGKPYKWTDVLVFELLSAQIELYET
jgi:hypothetical protein